MKRGFSVGGLGLEDLFAVHDGGDEKERELVPCVPVTETVTCAGGATVHRTGAEIEGLRISDDIGVLDANHLEHRTIIVLHNRNRFNSDTSVD